MHSKTFLQFMKYSITTIFFIVFSTTQAQYGSRTIKYPRFYVGADAYVRREAIKLIDPGGQVAPSDWMRNASYGFNAGYQPNKWLTFESGLYRFTFANRVNFSSSFFTRSFSEPYSSWVIPARAYIDPFAFSQPKPKRWRLQLMAGIGVGSLKRYEGPPTKFSGTTNAISFPDEGRFPDEPFHFATSQIVNGWVLNLEGGINAQYQLGQHLSLSGTYGHTIGLNTVHQQTITYRSTPIGPIYQASQTSAGSGRMVMFGLKYRLGR